MTAERPPSRRRLGSTAEIAIVVVCVFGGIGLVAAADLAGMPGLRWLGAGLVIAGGVAIAATSRW